jgi:hypothetical protein
MFVETYFKICLFFVQALETCVGTAGFSIGEFAALVFAGALSFADGLCDLFSPLHLKSKCFFLYTTAAGRKAF